MSYLLSTKRMLSMHNVVGFNGVQGLSKTNKAKQSPAFFGKCVVLCFLVTPVTRLRFAYLPYYR